jgi:heme O synthase-like polyprenyltransferase
MGRICAQLDGAAGQQTIGLGAICCLPTLHYAWCCAVAAAVMTLASVINSLAIHAGWQLDQHKFALTLYRTSQFVLAMLLAFRHVSKSCSSAQPNLC